MPSDDDASDRSFLFFGKKKNKKNTENTDTTSSKTDYETLTSEASSVSEGLFNVIRKGEDYSKFPAATWARRCL